VRAGTLNLDTLDLREESSHIKPVGLCKTAFTHGFRGVFGQPLIRAVVDANFSADMVLYWDEVVLKYFKGMTCRFPSM